MEKRNVVEAGRTPLSTSKTAEVVDAGVELFAAAGAGKTAPGKDEKAKKEKAHAAG
jgi:hypothetical protein